MKRVITFLLALFCFAFTHAKEYYFKHIGVADGLSQISISAIYQDELGAVWLGTSEGLNRYNGQGIRVFRPSQHTQGLTNNEIYELCGNRKGQMYIRSGYDLIKLDLYTEQFTCLRTNDVRNLFCTEDTLWVICKDGIYYYTEENQELRLFTQLQEEEVGEGMALWAEKETVWVTTRTHLIAISLHHPERHEVMATYSSGRCLSRDSSGHIWVGTWEGLYRISPNREITYYKDSEGEDGLSDNQIRCIAEDDSGTIWVGTFRGLNSYDPATDTWKQYTRYGNSPNTLSHNSILALHKDMQGNIWVGTYHGGANVFNPDKNYNRFYYADPLREGSLSFPVVGEMTEDRDGNLWICTEGGGLNCFHIESKTFTRIYQEGNPGSIESNNLKSIYYCEANNRLYVGTHLGGLFVLDLDSNQGHTLRRKSNPPTSFQDDIINDIQPYKNGLVLFTQRGIFFMDPATEKLSSLSNDPQVLKILNREYAYNAFRIDSRQRLWLAPSSGGIICVHLPSSRVIYYQPDAQSPSSIGKFRIAHIFEDSQGGLFFCTVGSGLFRFQEETQAFKGYHTANQSLPSDYCYYLCESGEANRLYLLHSEGLSVFDTEQEETEYIYNLFHQSYSRGSSVYRSQAGTVFIGGTNGLASIREENLFSSPTDNLLTFDKLYLFNKEILPQDDSGILSEILAKTTDIYLKHNQNHLIIEFSAFNYRFDRNSSFEYRLEGFDDTWIQTTGTTLTYTNLPSGRYTLKVRELDNKSNPLKETGLNIHVAAPFYATTWAYLFYFLLLLAIMTSIILFKTRQAALRTSLEFERKEKERIEELNQTKLRFFTNISHEFRTPLTLILGQIELLMQMDKLGPAVYNRILRIYKNAWHMRGLISELLDFRKQEQGFLKLKIEEQDLVSFTRQVYMSFYEYSQKKEINYRFIHAEKTVIAWFDPAQLQKVIFNLLSNAFKYTSHKGDVTIEIKKTTSQVLISVTDTGVGIQEEHVHKIFDRFYQVGNSSSGFTLGTGIGLVLSKGIIEMHHGRIDVKSTPGQGTTFTVVLSLGNQHFSKEELVNTESPATHFTSSDDSLVLPFYDQVVMKQETETINGETEEDKPVILLVEDNEELLAMLSEAFTPRYEVHTAQNGREALEIVPKIEPDLILSDVMMPEMTGKELCYKIKNNVEFSHISVVLLTAQTSVEHILEGLMFGADDYVTKPFNIRVLLARCNNLVKNRKRLMAYYAGTSMSEAAEMGVMNENDRELLEKCVTVVRQNFDNPEFDVTALASELCMGKSKLYMQFKQMIGLTPNEFILKVKLDEAMLLLKNHPELNIMDISVRLGFSSPRYFSKCFKSFFGIPPLEARKKRKAVE